MPAPSDNVVALLAVRGDFKAELVGVRGDFKAELVGDGLDHFTRFKFQGESS